MRSKHRMCNPNGIDLTQALECVGNGWHPLVTHVYEEAAKYDPKIIFTQVKEKFGMLRIYWDSPDRQQSDAKHALPFCEVIRDAEGKSAKICELCGEPGKIITSRNWLMARCPEHEEHTI